MANKFNLDLKLRKFDLLKRTLPRVIGNMAVNHFRQSFKSGGFTDGNFQAWPKRKPGSKRNAGRAILVDSGALKNSILMKDATFDKIRISSEGLAYADVHNRGLRAGRGRGFKMPKRKFMGNSKKLQKDMRVKINSSIRSIF